MTRGPAFLFLPYCENLKGRLADFFIVFGRVPFFYYILHVYLIHLIAMIGATMPGFGGQNLILSTWITFDPQMKGYGYPLWVVYAVWVLLIVVLFPICWWFERYKMTHREKWWLSYL